MAKCILIIELNLHCLISSAESQDLPCVLHEMLCQFDQEMSFEYLYFGNQWNKNLQVHTCAGSKKCVCCR